METADQTPVYQTDALIAEDILAYLDKHQHKTMLRFITCGSVDDGKSTLIGRLLYDSKMIFEDQLAALEADSKRVGTRPSANRASLSMSPIASSRPKSASSSSPTRRGTNSIRATWSPAPRRQTLPSS